MLPLQIMLQFNRWKIRFDQPVLKPKRGLANLLDQAEARRAEQINDLASADGGGVSTGAALWMSGGSDLDGLVSWVRDPNGVMIERTPRYPVWQFQNRGVLPGVREVVAILRSSSNNQWRVMRYFLTPRKQLGNLRPLDLLRLGEVERVLKHVRQEFET